MNESNRCDGKSIHVTLLHLLDGVLVEAILLPALSKVPEEPANRHLLFIVLVEKPAGRALHAQPTQPVPANRPPEIPPVQRRNGGFRPCRPPRISVKILPRRRRGSSAAFAAGVQRWFEVKAESPIGIIH